MPHLAMNDAYPAFMQSLHSDAQRAHAERPELMTSQAYVSLDMQAGVRTPQRRKEGSWLCKARL